MLDMQQIALTLLTHGYTPLRLDPGEKYTKATGWSTTVPSEESLKREFARPSNMGLRCGDMHRDGTCLVAIDVDLEDAQLIKVVERAIGTRVPVKRGKKGYTYFIRFDRQLQTSRIALKRNGKNRAAIDVLARGAQTVIPPSIHPETGKPYVWVAGTPLTELPYNEIPVFGPWLLDEIRGFCANPDDKIVMLNDMTWAGVGGGGDTHDTCLAAVSSMVARKWTDEEIQHRVQRAKREACEEAGEAYNWPEAESVIQGWINSSRDKKFDTTAKKRRDDDIPLEIINNYVYVVEVDRMYDLEKNVMLNRAQFENKHWRDMNKPWPTMICCPDLRMVDKLTYSPGQPRFCKERSFNSNSVLDCINVWVKNDIDTDLEGDITPWLDMMRLVFDGDEEAIRHVTSFLAFMIQNPGERINHALVIQGAQGLGKDSIFKAVAAILGQHNVASVTLPEVESQFNDWMFGRQLIIFQEMLAPGRRAIYNKLKTVITDETAQINGKHMPVYRVYNRAAYVFLTNYKHALSIDPDDRRMWVWHSRMRPQPKEYYIEFYKWLANKLSASYLYNYLVHYDTSKFSATAHPPMTSGKRLMIRSSSGEVEQYLQDAFENNAWPLGSDLVNMNHIVTALRPIMKVSSSLVRDALEHISEEGVIDIETRPRLREESGKDVRVRLWAIRNAKKWKDAKADDLLKEYRMPLPPMQGETEGSYTSFSSGPKTRSSSSDF